MSYIKLDNNSLDNTLAEPSKKSNENFQKIFSTAKSSNSSSPFNQKIKLSEPILLADASNFDFRKLGLNGERLGYPDKAGNQTQTQKNKKPSSGKTQLKARSFIKGAGWVGGAILLSDLIKDFVGPPPILKSQLALGKDRDLAITIYGKQYKGSEAEPGTAYFTRGIGGKRLDVPVTVTESGLTFDPDILQKEYGKPLPENLEISNPEISAGDQKQDDTKPDLKPGLAVEIRTQEERDLLGSMLAQGKTTAEITTALMELRHKTGGAEKAAFIPCDKNYDYNTVIKRAPRMGEESMIFVNPKDGNQAHDGVLSGLFNNRTGDMNIGFYSSSLNGKNIGTELISSAIEEIGPEKVKTVSGSLLFDDSVHQKMLENFSQTNLSVYQKNIAAGMPMEQAIWHTPLGKSMTRLGFNNLTITSKENLDFKFGFR